MQGLQRVGTRTPSRSRCRLGLTTQPTWMGSTSALRPGRASTVVHAKRVVALDFDGVICDSCDESSRSALRAAAIVWPEIFNSAEATARKEELLAKMRIVRPVVETGYENIVQMRLLWDGVAPEEMLASWGTMLPDAMKRLQLQRQPLVELFGKVRDEWIASDLDTWLGHNAMYEGVPQAVAEAMAAEEVYIVTTKQAHFTQRLLADMARLPFPAERIFSQTLSGRPKGEVLAMLQARHPQAAAYIFVEDKYTTLEKVAKAPGLEPWQLYLVDWGYNTPAERQAAADNNKLRGVIGLQQFASLMAGTLK